MDGRNRCPPDGELAIRPLRTAKATDRYTLRGVDGNEQRTVRQLFAFLPQGGALLAATESALAELDRSGGRVAA